MICVVASDKTLRGHVAGHQINPDAHILGCRVAWCRICASNVGPADPSNSSTFGGVGGRGTVLNMATGRRSANRSDFHIFRCYPPVFGPSVP
jgi:hypothetical protein